jgi:hypothetical protein
MKPNQKNPIPRGISIDEAAQKIFTTQVEFPSMKLCKKSSPPKLFVTQSGAEKSIQCVVNPIFKKASTILSTNI